ncbi:MAG: hypothetical protein EXR63_02100 [Dehalococcoidia bacterium]|nr:hypothetical protein [Dehalococcoidia bacterium]
MTITVAHHAGNRLDWLRRAEAAHVDYIETDVWFERDAVAVRHAARVGRLPLLRERWRLSLARGAPALELLVDALAPGTRLLLDLKGTDLRLALAVRELLAARAPARTYAVCSPVWPLLAPFADVAEAEVWHSVGSAAALDAVGAALVGSARPALMVDHRVLTEERLAALRAFAPLVVAWTVNSVPRAHELLRWGVSGITSDDLALLAELPRD